MVWLSSRSRRFLISSIVSSMGAGSLRPGSPGWRS
jgi:hypothetical protein